jgi:ribosomal protein S18 acetylase RimI-like enzyme
MRIRRLTPLDAAAFQALRLFALKDAPSAFSSSYDEEEDIAAAVVAGRLLLEPDRGVFGAFQNEALVGMVGVNRERKNKLAHKASIWGMYVAPSARGVGVARALLLEAVSLARSVPEIQQINLSVVADNASAIRLYESVGFAAFGCELDALLIDGKLHDEMYMCLRLGDGPSAG